MGVHSRSLKTLIISKAWGDQKPVYFFYSGTTQVNSVYLCVTHLWSQVEPSWKIANLHINLHYNYKVGLWVNTRVLRANQILNVRTWYSLIPTTLYPSLSQLQNHTPIFKCESSNRTALVPSAAVIQYTTCLVPLLVLYPTTIAFLE